MLRRIFTRGLVSAVLAVGGMSAQAGSLPTTLDTLTAPGASVTLNNLEFSNFSCSPSPPGSPPPASQVTVDPLGPPTSDTGLQFIGSFFAGPGTIVDYAIGCTVTALSGKSNDASLVITGGNFGGTGTVDVGETITGIAPDGSIANRHLDASIPGSVSDTVTFPPQTTVNVTKNIILVGGSTGASVSIIDQTFSTTNVPEPTLMALLGIGLSGLIAFRRFLKRAFVA